jgi:hypothetical protein
MSSEDTTFFGKLHKSFPDLEKLIQERKYIILEPKKKLIVASALTKNFYYNHIFYISPYDPSLYINLNGKVLKYEHPKFTSYLGWKKEMILTIKDSYSSMSSDITCYQLDNVCDEINYTETKSIIKDNQLQKKQNMDEYLKYNIELLKNETYGKAYDRLRKFTKEMKTNYMFMKGYEDNYSRIFNKRCNKIISKFTEVLRSPKDEYNTSFAIASQLVDSLIFNDLYKYLFNQCLVNFNKEDEAKIKNFLKDNPPKYEWDGLKIDEIYNKCRFLSAIQFLDNISNYKTVFEKMEVLTNVNTLISEEAKNIYESHEKGNFIPQGDLLLSFWIYVVAHCKTKNIIAESQFINLFGLNGYNASNYVATTFVTAVDSIKLELLQSEKLILSQYVEPNKISLPSS